MVEKSSNKIIGETKVETKTEVVQKEFFFPEYQITVKAGSLEEAQTKLLEIINKDK